ncbi:hypothetical protein ABT160_02730 [Streptomyces sp. NPDC001941]|uniref:hypothetical protein n=1 Tax=Streptomyces sp. NPDC001941 TaxID=3154659 RepID=UPI003317F998
MPWVVPAAESRQYDGANAADLAAWIGADEYAETGDALTLTVTVWGLTNDVVLQPGWWLIRQVGQCGGAHSPEDYARLWHELPTA